MEHDDPLEIAEARRREGRLDEAERLVRAELERDPDALAAGLLLSLVLLDRGRPQDAHRVLERLAEATLDGRGEVARAFALSERELDRAFEAAAPEADQMLDADHVAQEAMRLADRDLAQELAGPSSAFATRTMAELLESQGDERGATAIRASLEIPDDEMDRVRTLATLERWLEKLRRDVA